MNNSLPDILTGLLIAGTIIYLIALLIIAQNKYSLIVDHAKKSKTDFKEDLGGLWKGNKGGGSMSGAYWFRTPLPISIKTKNTELNQLIDSHNKTIKLFWTSALIGLPAVIVILNLIN